MLRDRDGMLRVVFVCQLAKYLRLRFFFCYLRIKVLQTSLRGKIVLDLSPEKCPSLCNFFRHQSSKARHLALERHLFHLNERAAREGPSLDYAWNGSYLASRYHITPFHGLGGRP